MTTTQPSEMAARTERPAMWRRRPEIDVYETSDEYVVRADMPGVAPEHFTVQIDRNELLISGKRMRPTTGQALYGPTRDVEYQRRIGLPDGVVTDKVEARMNAGVVTVQLPKRADLRPRRIEVQAQS